LDIGHKLRKIGLLTEAGIRLVALIRQRAKMETADMFQCAGFAAQGANVPLAPFSFNRRVPGPKDVEIEILFCGVCHSDLHQTRNEWQNTVYPCLPGHEIVGRVTKTGAEATLFKTGDLAAVGCMVDSCRTCGSCREGLEQFCERGFTPTYNGVDKVLGGGCFAAT
jgi:uncharacterized zinc-type alcohol dehydrogenase-like protein